MSEWDFVRYDNGEEGCPNCKRHRLYVCENGKHLCEKCGWCPELQEYIAETAP